jgi:hypothetical protein
MPLSIKRETSLYKQALDYVTKERKITADEIDKYKIGYTESGDYKFRIIFPSLNKSGRINYFEARSYLKGSKMSTYKKPPEHQVKASEIIFDEFFINWDLPVYLTEGALDSRRLPNGLPMLGKIHSDLIITLLLKHDCTVIVALDTDAMQKGIEVYKTLSSLGLNVYFLDLKGHKDVAKIYENYGQEKLTEILKTGIHKINEVDEFNKILNE